MPNYSSPRYRTYTSAGWLSRTELSGKLFVVGGLLGFIAVFLPLVSSSMEIMWYMSSFQTSMVVDDWRGKVSLLGYLAALAFAWFLYPPNGSPVKLLTWAATVVGAILLLLGFSLLFDTIRSRSGGNLMRIASIDITPGIGSFVNVAAAAVVAWAAMIKAQKDRLLFGIYWSSVKWKSRFRQIRSKLKK